MTKTDQQAFEAWAADRGLDLTLTTDGIGLDKYQSVSTQAAFAAWQERDAQLAAVTQQRDELVEAVNAMDLEVTRWWLDGRKTVKADLDAVLKASRVAARIQSEQPKEQDDEQ